VKSPRQHKGAEAGFTLLEILIVLVLLGLLAAVLSGALYLGVSARARIDKAANDQADLAAFQRIVTNQLSRTYPDWIKVGPNQAIDFTGGPDHLAFLAPALMAQGQGLAEYSLSVADRNGQNVLLLSSTLSASGAPPAWQTSFASGLAGIKFAYFGPPRDGGSATWQNDWVMRTIPPELISIAVTFPRGDRRAWPVFVIHPEIDADVTCEIDASTHRCLGR
jgi:prepilin-type N-terminal cleavage/methylation domain-containing protein